MPNAYFTRHQYRFYLFSCQTLLPATPKALESFESLLSRAIQYGQGKISQPYRYKDGSFAKFRWNNSISPKFDVIKSDSIVSPYIATLTISGSKCITKAAQQADAIIENFECPERNSPSDIGILQSYRFSLQKGKWVLTGSKVDIPSAGVAGRGSWDDTNFLFWLFDREIFDKLQ